jgi:DMSO/TMAO reductase YedYZ heme-binding membrane subunit
LSINLQVARVSITSLGLQPALFNVTSAGAYDPVTGTVSMIGLYIAPIVTGAGIALSMITVLIMLPLSVRFCVI